MKNNEEQHSRALDTLGLLIIVSSIFIGCATKQGNDESIHNLDPRVFVPTIVSGIDIKAEKFYREAAKLYHTGDYSGANKKFTDWIDRFSENSDIDNAIIKIVLCRVKLGEFDELNRSEFNRRFSNLKSRFPEKNNLVTILEKYVDSALYLRRLRQANQSLRDHLPGKHLIESQSSSRFEFLLRRALKDFLNNQLGEEFPYPELEGEFRLLIAQSFTDEKNYAAAYQELDRIATAEFGDYPDVQAEAMYKAAFCLKELRRYDESRGWYTEFMMQFPNSEYITDAYFNLGEISEDLKDYNSAHLNYKFALKRATDTNQKSKIQLTIGQAYHKQEKIEEALKTYNALLNEDADNLLAKFHIASLHHEIARRDESIDEFNKSIDGYKWIIEKHGETEVRIEMPNRIDGPINPSLIAFCPHFIGSINYEIATKHREADEIKKAKQYYFEALRWSIKLVTDKGFKNEENVPQGLKNKDLRTDPLSPESLYGAMLTLNSLRTLGVLGREEELELYKILEVSLDELSKLGIEGVLEHVASKYISDHYLNNALLSAQAQLRYSHIKRRELQDYEGAAVEYAKLQDYRPSPKPEFGLIMLQGKYYGGLCYEELSRPEDAKKAYQEAITLFNTTFQPLIDTPDINVPHLNKEQIDYCIQTATSYAERIRGKLNEAGQKSGDTVDETMNTSQASGTPDTPDKSERNGQMTAQELAKTVSESMVFLEMDNNVTGSGFFVAPGQIATNFHVVERTVRGTARLVGTDRKYAIVGYTAVDAERDLAILKVRAFGVPPLILGDSEKVNQGNPVYPVGNPRGLVNVVSDGKISSIQWVDSHRKTRKYRDVKKDDTPYKLFTMTAPIFGGNSGGPVLNANGHVIGIATGGLGSWEKFPVRDARGKKMTPQRYVVVRYLAQNLNYAVPVNYLKPLLNRARTASPQPLSDLEIVY